LPVVKINGTLRGISFKIRYDSVKPHYRFVLEYLIGELPVLWSRLDGRLVEHWWLESWCELYNPYTCPCLLYM